MNQINNPILKSAHSETPTYSVHYSDDLLKSAVIEVLAVESLDFSTIKNIERDIRYLRSQSPRGDQLLGALSFIVLCFRSYNLFDTDTFEFQDQALLEFAETSKFINTFYDIPNHLWINTAEFIDHGTTSIILKVNAETVSTAALKLLQPRYFHLNDVTGATRAYRDRFGFDDAWSPAVYASAANWIMMDYIDGLNLERYLYEFVFSNGEITESTIEYCAFIVDNLLQALAHYSQAEPSVSHLDLSPKNIMIESDSVGKPRRVLLIDFGRNFILDQSVGPRTSRSEYYQRALLFAPPEIYDIRDSFQPKADLYSLGMIILEMISGRALSREQIGHALLQGWQSWPSVARVVEDIIDEDPALRGIEIRFDTLGFEGIRKRFADEIQLLKRVYLPSVVRERYVSFSMDIFGPAFHQASQLAQLAREGIGLRGIKAAGAIYLAFWARLSQLSYYIVFATFFALVTADWLTYYNQQSALELLQLDDLIAIARQAGFIKYELGKPFENIWGWLVCLSFGLIATKYYLNVFSMVSTLGIKTAGAIIAEIALRLNAFFYTIPIFVTYIVNPKYWPFCVFAGLLPVAVNNFVLGKFISKRWSKLHEIFSTEQVVDSENFVKLFREWAPQMFIYATFFLVTGVLLLNGWAKDEYLYALFAVSLNFFQITRIVVGSQAPRSRANLSRLLFLIRKRNVLEARGEIT